MDEHTEMLDLVGPWALDACDPDEAAMLEAHLDGCVSCADQARRLRHAAGWLGVDRLRPPPAALRETVLAVARTRRPPSAPRTLTGAYARQVAVLDQVLGGLRPGDWQRPDHRHGTVGGVLAHLAGNDAQLAADVGLPVVPIPAGADGIVHKAWREQAQILADGLTAADDLEHEVRLASPGPPPRRPLRDALVQRAFETWTHHDDIVATVGGEPATPPPEQVRRIVDLAVGLLPRAGACLPGYTVRLVLDGAAGGEWTLDGAGGDQPATPIVTIFADAVEFARLVANRRHPRTLPHRIDGDHAVASKLLRTAATLGCD